MALSKQEIRLEKFKMRQSAKEKQQEAKRARKMLNTVNANGRKNFRTANGVGLQSVKAVGSAINEGLNSKAAVGTTQALNTLAGNTKIVLAG